MKFVAWAILVVILGVSLWPFKPIEPRHYALKVVIAVLIVWLMLAR